MRRKDELFLYDILVATRDAIELARGRTRQDLDHDLSLRLSLTYLIQTIGEASPSLSDEFKAAHPGIPWADIVGMRNKIVHEYWRIDRDRIWDTVKDDLPELLDWIAPFTGAEE
jgi:uncharacterized protein with HEPN domain